MRKYILLLSVLALNACVQQPNGSFEVSTNSIGNFLHQQTGINGSGSSASLPRGTTEYAGQIDGGTAKAELKWLSPTQYHLDLGATGTGQPGQITGAGGAEGVITASGTAGVFTMTRDDDNMECDLTVTLTSSTLQIAENFDAGRTGCMTEHGAALSFDGVLNRTQ